MGLTFPVHSGDLMCLGHGPSPLAVRCGVWGNHHSSVHDLSQFWRPGSPGSAIFPLDVCVPSPEPPAAAEKVLPSNPFPSVFKENKFRTLLLFWCNSALIMKTGVVEISSALSRITKKRNQIHSLLPAPKHQGD